MGLARGDDKENNQPEALSSGPGPDSESRILSLRVVPEHDATVNDQTLTVRQMLITAEFMNGIQNVLEC